LALSQLRIPRLNYPKAVVFLQIAFLWFFDGLLFGVIDLGIMGKSRVEPYPLSNIYSTFSFHSEPRLFFNHTVGRPEQLRESFNLLDLVAPLSFGLFTPSSSVAVDTHLLGQHTVRMSPVSTAQLNPNGLTYCLAPPGNSILIPVLLNNTTPLNVRYSLLPLGYTDGEPLDNVENFELNAKDLKAIEKARVESLPLVRQASFQQRDSDEYDEYDDDDEVAETQNAHSTLQKSQSLTHIRITKPGRLRLLRVLDMSNTEARILHPTEIVVAPCPHVQFVDDATPSQGHDVHCAGQNTDLELIIDIHGVPPLSLRWSMSVNGRKEHFLVEGIEGGHDHREHSPHSVVALKQSDKGDVPQDLKIPLAISLDAPGRHEYALEEVIDGLGNIIPVNPEVHTSIHPDSEKNGLDRRTGMVNSKIIRSLVVLRRPAMSFKHCGPGSPTPLLVGSEAPLVISAKDADLLDAPWEVILKYQPEDNSRRPKPWKKTLKTLQDEMELSFMANAPGEYTILGVKGKVRLVYSPPVQHYLTKVHSLVLRGRRLSARDVHGSRETPANCAN
jgi:nucleoporin POM152